MGSFLNNNQKAYESNLENFEIKIFKEISKLNIGKNIAISPLSIYHILSLVANGAKDTTLKELLFTLNNKNQQEMDKVNKSIFTTITKYTNEIEFANAIFTKINPENNFIKIVKEFKAEINILKDTEQINKWCNENTHGKIPKIIESIKPNDVMILLNAIYFNGLWKYPFDKKNNFESNFMNYNKEPKKIEFMSLEKKFNYYEDEEIQAIFLKYQNESLSAVIILPNKEINLNEYIQNFENEKFNLIIKNSKEKDIQLNMPKFEISYESEMIPFMKNLGVKEAFTLNANFTGMCKEKNIFINQIMHKTFIKVDENGTEAASVTDVKMELSLPPPVDVDHPFLFIVTAEDLPSNHKVLFMSKIECL